jgi:hypothetical protein
MAKSNPTLRTRRPFESGDNLIAPVGENKIGVAANFLDFLTCLP